MALECMNAALQHIIIPFIFIVIILKFYALALSQPHVLLSIKQGNIHNGTVTPGLLIGQLLQQQAFGFLNPTNNLTILFFPFGILTIFLLHILQPSHQL